MYNSLNFDSYNAETRQLMQLDAGNSKYCQIIIGTDTLSVGIAMRARLDAVLIGDIEDTDEVLQKFGRINREKKTEDARGIIYITSAARKLAEKLVANDGADLPKKPGQTPPDLSMARLILATCKVREQNVLYNNPVSDPPCTCAQCENNCPLPLSSSCNCSGCLPEPKSISSPAPRPRAPKPIDNIPKKDRLSRLKRSHGQKRLLNLRLEIWRNADQSKYWI
jgi:hypothetical protein